MPKTELWLSPQHRVLLRNRVTKRMFGFDEALVHATHLTALQGVQKVKNCDAVEYWHIALDSHEVVYANGVLAESLFLGVEFLKRMPRASLIELDQIFPGILDGSFCQPEPAKPFVKGQKSKKLAERLAKNKRTAYEPEYE